MDCEKFWFDECNDLEDLIGILEDNCVAERKLRLFAVACCRNVWHLLPEQPTRIAVKFAEEFADNQEVLNVLDEINSASEEALFFADQASVATDTKGNLYIISKKHALDADYPSIAYGVSVASFAKHNAVEISDSTRMLTAHNLVPEHEWGTAAGDSIFEETGPKILKEHVRLLHDIFGNPFRPVIFDLAWLTPTVKRLAQTAYDDRNFDLLPILADALEEAGCDNADVLDHCRTFPIHVRGCWVVDSILGKT